jgi:Dyp-type peroxidase family
MPETLQTLLNNSVAIAAADGDYRALFSDLQSNILSPHAKFRTHYFFVRFKSGSENAWRFLLSVLTRNAAQLDALQHAITGDSSDQDLVRRLRRVAEVWSGGESDMGALCKAPPGRMLSEYEVYWQSRMADKQARGVPGGELLVNVLLSRSGCKRLGLQQPQDGAFREGMAERGDRLNDPLSAEWDPAYREDDSVRAIAFDAMISLAYNPIEDARDARVDVLKARIEAHSDRSHEEIGNVLTARKESIDPKTLEKTTHLYSIEPFGFRDGISQPLFYAAELAKPKNASSAYKPFAPLSLALCKDPNGRTEQACGSYIVYRKLRQKIDLFYTETERLARQGIGGEALREQFIGRKRDGTPLAAANPALLAPNPERLNDFDFTDDQHGATCPFTAHIRKNNPRRDVHPSYNPNKHRIVRRALPYGPAIVRDPDGKPSNGKATPLSDEPLKEIGLLFFCAQADIEGQFEHVQGVWANSPGHPRGKPSDFDRLTGQTGTPEGSTVRLRHGHGAELKSAVRLRGGDYYFAPSIGCIQDLLDFPLE